jgi:hypothetical protein
MKNQQTLNGLIDISCNEITTDTIEVNQTYTRYQLKYYKTY